jgi:glycosyltransferase involved in cell wall biosynthesis
VNKLLHVITGLGTGGTEMMCLRLVRHWQHRFEQNVVALSPSTRALERDFDNIDNCTLSVGTCKSQSYFKQWIWLRETISHHRPNAVVIHCFGVPHLLAASAARAMGVKSLIAWAGNPPPETEEHRYRWRSILMISRLLRCPIASCSKAVERELKDLGVGLPSRSLVIPNGIDTSNNTEKTSQGRRPRTGIGPVIGMISRLDAIKDHKTLLRAFDLLRRRIPEANLWIIGDGVLRQTLEATAHDLGISASVKFFGNRNDVPNLLGQIDTFAFSTTRNEGFGIALIEAMAAAVPIVASDVAACREVLSDGEAGLLVPPADANALAEAIVLSLEDDRIREILTQAALRCVRSHYSIEACAERFETLLFKPSSPRRELTECAS